jgi:hypothetical protein
LTDSAAVAAGGSGLPADGSNGFGWDSNATIAGRCDYMVNVSDCGVAVWHEGRIAATLLRAPDRGKLGDVNTSRIAFSIPCAGRPGKSWRYAVAVGGCGLRSGRLTGAAGAFVAVAESPSDSTGGGGTADGTNPNFYDILLPPGLDQRAVLGDYDAAKRRLVSVPLVGNDAATRKR